MKAITHFVVAALTLAWAGSMLNAETQPRLVSAPSLTNAAASGGSFLPVFSADGRQVIFTSAAGNLLPHEHLGGSLNVYARDLTSGILRLINCTTNGGFALADAVEPSVSSNAQFIAFASAAGNLVAGDTNNASDIFVRDQLSGTTTLVSVGLDGQSPVHPYRATNSPLSSHPRISADGRWVFFESLATNLVAIEDTNREVDIFVRDLLAGTTTLVSVNLAGQGTANARSELSSITPDGRFAAFVSAATDLDPAATNSLGDVFIRDVQQGVTFGASTNVAWHMTVATNGYVCLNPVLSADGAYVAFKAAPRETNVAWLFVQHLTTGNTTVLSTNSGFSTPPSLSADGRWAAGESGTNVYVWEIPTGSNVLVNVNAAGTGLSNGRALAPTLTPDGTRVAFVSSATDLTPNATNGLPQIYVRDLASNITQLVSVNREGIASRGDFEIYPPTISADGRWIAFESDADDLVANDRNQASDVFVHELAVGLTRLLSSTDPAQTASTGPARKRIRKEAISADGRWAIFTSFDDSLAEGDTNRWRDVFVRDLIAGTNLPVSLLAGITNSQIDVAFSPVLSADGRFCAFLTSRVPYEFFTEETFIGACLWIDLQTGETRAIVHPSGYSSTFRQLALSASGQYLSLKGPSDADVKIFDIFAQTNWNVITGQGSSSFTNIAFTPDGSWSFILSRLTGVTTNATGGAMSLYAHDLLNRSNYLVSLSPEGDPTWGCNGAVSVATDSRHVAFASTNGTVALHDLESHTSQFVAGDADAPSLSADARFIAYETPVSGLAPRQIVVKDLRTGLTSLASVNRSGTGGGNREARQPLLSADGRFVVFTSAASDLAPNDSNNARDVFVRDLRLGTTLLVSLNRWGTGAGNGPSSHPVMSADGRTVIFQSFASDLVAGDFNDRRDVFVLKLGRGDADGDGLDDDWELAYFNTLARDGSGDFDQDGQSDQQEFQAGTDPTNAGSVLRVLTLSAPGAGAVTILWSAVPGQSYQVQFKDGVNDAEWTTLPGTITASSATGQHQDTSAGATAQRFYRVVVARE